MEHSVYVVYASVARAGLQVRIQFLGLCSIFFLSTVRDVRACERVCIESYEHTYTFTGQGQGQGS